MYGCIVGDCDYCDMPVYETDWSDTVLQANDVFVHQTCAKKYKQGKRRNDYIKNLEFENKVMLELIKKEKLQDKLEEMRFLLKSKYK